MSLSKNEVQAQYEAYPYPDRDPADEKKRLITGSPSWPQEMDHHLWGGARDWSRPLRALVAGGGTGDGLIQLAQMLTSAGRSYDITYLDLSQAARKVASARAAARGLGGINFVTGSLLEAGKLGEFDYIDCCGVLHHLPEPQAGFDALARALAPGGGIGCMVYAPLGRSGVYPLQDAFRTLFDGLSPQERLGRAKAVFAGLPEGHPFNRNPHLVDHDASDAGFYDLLLHSSDRPYTIGQLLDALDAAGLELAGVPEPALYQPETLLPAGVSLPGHLDQAARMGLAENLRGTFKTHVVYAVRAGARMAPPLGKPGAIPHLRGIDPARLAQALAQKGQLRIAAGGAKVTLTLPKAAAKPVAAIDGRRDLAAIRHSAGMDPIAFAAAWSPLEKALTGYGQMHYSTLLKAGPA
ncbi:MAG: class I SAM-dependent methyltransferase [Rhodobacter sp.]|nr:class I SAM-dependent methyltransferase [Rhodobacter sp.]